MLNDTAWRVFIEGLASCVDLGISISHSQHTWTQGVLVFVQKLVAAVHNWTSIVVQCEIICRYLGVERESWMHFLALTKLDGEAGVSALYASSSSKPGNRWLIMLAFFANTRDMDEHIWICTIHLMPAMKAVEFTLG